MFLHFISRSIQCLYESQGIRISTLCSNQISRSKTTLIYILEIQRCNVIDNEQLCIPQGIISVHSILFTQLSLYYRLFYDNVGCLRCKEQLIDTAQSNQHATHELGTITQCKTFLCSTFQIFASFLWKSQPSPFRRSILLIILRIFFIDILFFVIFLLICVFIYYFSLC